MRPHGGRDWDAPPLGFCPGKRADVELKERVLFRQGRAERRPASAGDGIGYISGA
jgi:hypothetical protein